MWSSRIYLFFALALFAISAHAAVRTAPQRDPYTGKKLNATVDVSTINGTAEARNISVGSGASSACAKGLGNWCFGRRDLSANVTVNGSNSSVSSNVTANATSPHAALQSKIAALEAELKAALQRKLLQLQQLKAQLQAAHNQTRNSTH